MKSHNMVQPFESLPQSGSGGRGGTKAGAKNSRDEHGIIRTSNRRILVVDDEALIRWSLREQLEKAGFEVFEAADGKAAMEFLGEGDGLGAIFLDLRLPDMDGLAILESVRQSHPHCRVIIMSAFGTPEKVEQALQMGAYRFIAKPFNYQQMVDLAGTALSDKSSS